MVCLLDGGNFNLLDGTCPEAIDRLKDQQFTPNLVRVLRNMQAAREDDAVELMIARSTITVAHAEALSKATQHCKRMGLPPAPEEKTAPLDQIVKLEKEMSLVKTQCKGAEQNYGSELLNLAWPRAISPSCWPTTLPKDSSNATSPKFWNNLNW